VSSAAWLAPSPAPLRSPTERERARGGGRFWGRPTSGSFYSGLDDEEETKTRRRCSGSEARRGAASFSGGRRTEVPVRERGYLPWPRGLGRRGWRGGGVGRDTVGGSGTAVAVRADAAGASIGTGHWWRWWDSERVRGVEAVSRDGNCKRKSALSGTVPDVLVTVMKKGWVRLFRTLLV
jgi:hypothetical protein